MEKKQSIPINPHVFRIVLTQEEVEALRGLLFYHLSKQAKKLKKPIEGFAYQQQKRLLSQYSQHLLQKRAKYEHTLQSLDACLKVVECYLYEPICSDVMVGVYERLRKIYQKRNKESKEQQYAQK